MVSQEEWLEYLRSGSSDERAGTSTDEQPSEETPTPLAGPHPPTTVPPETPGSHATTSAPTPVSPDTILAQNPTTSVPPETKGSHATTSAVTTPGSPATNLASHPETTIPSETPGTQGTTVTPTPGSPDFILDPLPITMVNPNDCLEETPLTGTNTGKKRGRPPGSKNKLKYVPPMDLEKEDAIEFPPMGPVNYKHHHGLSLEAEVIKGKWDKDREKKVIRQHAKWPTSSVRPAVITPLSSRPYAPPPFFPTATPPFPTDVAGPSSSAPPVVATTMPSTGENSTQQRYRGRTDKRPMGEPPEELPVDEGEGQVPAEAGEGQLPVGAGEGQLPVGAGEGIIPTWAGEGKFISVERGEDVLEKLISFAKQVRRKVTVLCAIGYLSYVKMEPIYVYISKADYPGVLDILYLHGSLNTVAKDSSQEVVQHDLRIQFADHEYGELKTGKPIGPLIALTTVEITLMVEKPPEDRPEKKQRKKKDDPENPSQQKRKKQKKDPDMGGGGMNAEKSAGPVAV